MSNKVEITVFDTLGKYSLIIPTMAAKTPSVIDVLYGLFLPGKIFILTAEDKNVFTHFDLFSMETPSFFVFNFSLHFFQVLLASICNFAIILFFAVLPFFILFLFLMLEVAVAVLQAYVFSILIVIYIRDIHELH